MDVESGDEFLMGALNLGYRLEAAAVVPVFVAALVGRLGGRAGSLDPEFVLQLGDVRASEHVSDCRIVRRASYHGNDVFPCRGGVVAGVPVW